MRLKRSEWIAIIVVGGFVVALLSSAIYPALRGTPQRRCVENLKALSRASETYSADTGGLLPPANIWTQAFLTRYIDQTVVLCCPEANPTEQQRAALDAGTTRGLPVGYAFNSDLSLTYAGYVANSKQVPLFFDSTVIAPNAAATVDTLDLRHEGKVGNIVYVDGHVETVTSVPVPMKPDVQVPKAAKPAATADDDVPTAKLGASENATDRDEEKTK